MLKHALGGHAFSDIRESRKRKSNRPVEMLSPSILQARAGNRQPISPTRAEFLDGIPEIQALRNEIAAQAQLFHQPGLNQVSNEATFWNQHLRWETESKSNCP